MIFGHEQKNNSFSRKVPIIIINRKGGGACVIIAHHKFTFIVIKHFLQYMHDTECFWDVDAHMKGNYGSFSGYTLNWKKYDIDVYGIILLRQHFNCKKYL
jgi:hypothetical protein